MPEPGHEKSPFTLTPYIIVKGAAAAIAFYEKAFGGVELFRLAEPGGRIGHAEVKLGDGGLMLADESPAFGALSPSTIGGTPVKLHLYVEDVDAVMKRAEAAGATVLRAAQDQFYGDRSGMIADPFGHQWFLATRKKAVSPEEMQEHYSESFKSK
ncbi:MAG TPA: VOC family protein [Rhizomicrobium sp.]